MAVRAWTIYIRIAGLSRCVVRAAVRCMLASHAHTCKLCVCMQAIHVHASTHASACTFTCTCMYITIQSSTNMWFELESTRCTGVLHCAVVQAWCYSMEHELYMVRLDGVHPRSVRMPCAAIYPSSVRMAYAAVYPSSVRMA